MGESLARRIGRRISTLRQARGLKLEQFAYQYDISKSYISDVEKGKHNVSFPMLTKIAKALGVYLVDLIPPRFPPKSQDEEEVYDVILDADTWFLAERIGEGNPSEGIRKALKKFENEGSSK